jgi:hypothetical protein
MRLKQRLDAFEKRGEPLNIGDWLSLCEHQNDGHTIDWALVRTDGAGVLQSLDALIQTPEEAEDLRLWGIEHDQQMAEERRKGIRKPGPVEPRLRRYVTSAASYTSNGTGR